MSQCDAGFQIQWTDRLPAGSHQEGQNETGGGITDLALQLVKEVESIVTVEESAITPPP